MLLAEIMPQPCSAAFRAVEEFGLEIESEIVHEVFSTALRSFNGDPETVSGIAKHLRGCLMLGRRKPGARNSYKALWTMTAILAAAIALYLKLR